MIADSFARTEPTREARPTPTAEPTHTTAVTSETASKRTLNSETANSETANAGVGSSKTVNSETVNSEAVDAETVNSEAVDAETVNSEAVDAETGESEIGNAGIGGSGVDWPSLLTSAHEALRGAVAGVPDGGWDRPTPCAEWTVTQVLQHAAGDQIGYAAALTGGPWPSEDPFHPSGHLDGEPAAVVADALRASERAWATVDRDAVEVANPLPQGPMPAWLAAGACALDAAVHAWDIAIATGQPSPLTPVMARDLLAVATRLVEPLRAWGAYAPALDPAPDDDETATLLRYLGRDPHPTAF